MNLDNNYRIVYDENNVILQFFDQREKKTKDGNVDFEFTENFYYPNMKTALTAFLMKSLHGSGSVEAVLQEIRRVESIISKLK